MFKKRECIKKSSRSINLNKNRQRFIEQLEQRLLMNSDWTNPARPNDVNNDMYVSPLDALVVINALNRRDGTPSLGTRSNPLASYLDTNGDSTLSPLDALFVINQLNSRDESTQMGPARVEGESEPAPAGFISILFGSLPGNSNQIVELTTQLSIGREEFNEMGLFVVDGPSGNVNGVAPTSPSYAEEVFSTSQRQVLYSRQNVFRTASNTVFPAGSTLGVYVLQETSDNGDPAQHLRVESTGTFRQRIGWEEHVTLSPWGGVGNRSYDDVLVDVQIGEPKSGTAEPVITNIPNQQIDELTEFVFDVMARDANLPNDKLTFKLDAPVPIGMAIDPDSGRIRWTPTEAQGPGVFNVRVRVTDQAGLFDLETFTIGVAETNPATDFSLAEETRFLTQKNVDVELGQTEGTRAVTFRLTTGFDETDKTSAFKDTLAVYMVDPANPTQTLLDRGVKGTSLFAMANGEADYVPGLVRFDGDIVTIDVTSLGTKTQGRLLFQLLNSDTDNGSNVRISNIRSTADTTALKKPVFADTPTVAVPGGAQVLTNFTVAPDVKVMVRNVRFNSTSGKYSADLSLMNDGVSLGRQVALSFSSLPTGVTLGNASGVDGTNRPYVNFASAIPSGGLLSGTESGPLLVEFTNLDAIRFAVSATVLAAGPNVAPVLPPIAPLTVKPGEIVRVNLPKQDANGDQVTYTLESSQTLPTGKLNGVLEFSPTPQEIGSYTFTLIASDGALETRQSVSLSVVADTLTSTRVTGRVLDVDQSPLSGMTVEIGTVRGLTGTDGSFTLDMGAGPLATDTIKIRGELFAGPNKYPFIAEKLSFVLDHAVFPNVNNVISRSIYLPKLDIANGTRIDPTKDTLVTTSVIPGATVMVKAGTLMNQQSTLFSDVLSITQVPPSLTPASLPANLRPDMVLTIQPGEMVFTTPAPLTFPNSANYDIGTILDLWSINPVTGQFDDVGDMQVFADATAPGGTIIRTTSGGVRNSSWHFPTPPDPEPDPEDDRDEDDDCDECKATDGNFEVEAHSGAVLDDHGFVTYQSMGQTQGYALHYDSKRADPRPIVHLGYSNLVPRANQRLVAKLSFMKDDFEFEMPGYEGIEYEGLSGGEHFWKLDVTGSGRVALQADFSAMESGLYTYELTSGPMQFNGTRFTGTLTTQTKELKVVNTIDSPFGAGWGLNGLIEIVENKDGSVLWIDGGGSELYFAAASALGQPLVSPPGNFSRLVKLSDGTYEQTMPDKMVYRYNSDHQIATKTDRNGNVWRYQFDSEKTISKITDPAGLETRFVKTNGRITSMIDPANRTTRFEYDTSGNLTRTIDPDTSSKSWDYDAGHRIISETDKRGFTEQVFYDYAGRAVRSLRADGTELKYDPVQTQILRPFQETIDPVNAPSVSSLTQIKSQFVDSNGNVTERRLDKQGQMVSGIDSEGALSAVGRNSVNLVTRSNDGRGNVTSFGYDARGNVTTVRDTITSSGASGVSSQGTDFWLSFQQNESSSATKTLFISSQTATTGNVSIPGLNFTQDFTVQPGQVTTVTLPTNVAVASSNTIVERGIRVTSELPVSVSGLNQQRATTDGFLGLPTQIAGREYLVMSSGANGGTHFAVVGITDGTEVTIVPTVTTSGRTAGTPFTIALDEGQVYYLQNNNNNADLTGTSISANAPVAVFSGHECGNVPPGVSFCDHMVEQLTPIETWGTAFATAPLSTRRNGDTFRVLTATDDTDITINGVVVATINRGEFFQTILTTPSAIIGTKPILVAQFSNGSRFDNTVSDPFMQLIPPVEQYDSSYTVSTPSSGFSSHFINITIPSIGTSNVTLDGAIILESSFTRIAGTEFSTAQIPVQAGTHSLSSPIPFGMYLYGFGNDDSYGFLGGQTFSPGSQRSYTYDEVFNQLLLFTDDLGQTTKYDLDPVTGNTAVQRRVFGEIDTPENGETDDLVTRYTYTTFALIDTTTDPLGRVTDYDYDPRGRLTSVTYAKGTTDEAIMRYEYDLAGNQTAMIDGNGNRTEYQYDSLNRMVKTIAADPDGAGPLTSPTTSVVYDVVGNVTSTTDANNRTSTNRYDDLNRLIESVASDPDGTGPRVAPVTQYAYDAVGNIDSVTDPNGNTTRYRYDGRNRRIESIDPDGGITKFAYDSDNNLSQVTDPVGNVTKFRYDARDRLVEEIDPLGKSIRYGYDAANNLVQKTDRNLRVTKYTYDDLNRLLKEEWIGAADAVVNTVTYRYDAAGNLLSVGDKDSNLAFVYDARNRVKSVDNAGTPGAPNVIVGYTYDDNSNVRTVVDTINGAAGATTLYNYDGLDRLNVLSQAGNNVSDKRVNFTYNPLGQYSAIDRYRDLAGTQLVIGTDYDYDAQNRLTRIDHKNAANTSVAFYDYVYDVASRISRITSVDGVVDYNYDDRDQLTDANYSNAAIPDEKYRYDANGNRVESHLHGTEYATDANAANRLKSDGKYSYEYDNEGNIAKRIEVVSGLIRVMEWDHRNRLVRVSDSSKEGILLQEVTFSYDSTNRRVLKSVDLTPATAGDTISYQFIYDREDVLLDFKGVGSGLDQRTQLTQRYLHGPDVDQVLAQGIEGILEWQLTDHLGTVRTVTNDSGTVLEQAQFDGFGNSVNTAKSSRSRYLYSGREFDVEISVYFHRGRYYDATVGRFQSEDPIRFAGGDVNLSRYVRNYSTGLTDPFGMFPWPNDLPLPGNPIQDAINAINDGINTANSILDAINDGLNAIQGVLDSVQNASDYVNDARDAISDFNRNYNDMKNDNTIGNDKYFHCKANCEASRRGPGGREMAEFLSDMREATDWFKFWRENDSECDQKANRKGRNGDPSQSCSQVCSSYRVNGMNPKY